MEEVIERQTVTIDAVVPKRIYITWEEFAKTDTADVSSMMNTVMATILDGGSMFYHDREGVFDFVEPLSTGGFDLDIEEMFEVIALREGIEALQDRELLMDAIDIRAIHEENPAEISDQHIQMLEVFGYPRTKQELTQKIYEYFYSDNDFYYLASKVWFLEPYLDLICEIQMEDITGFDQFYTTVNKIVEDRIASQAGGSLSIGYFREYLTYDYAFTKEGIIVDISDD